MSATLDGLNAQLTFHDGALMVLEDALRVERTYPNERIREHLQRNLEYHQARKAELQTQLDTHLERMGDRR